MDKLAALIPAVVGAASFLWSLLSSRRHLRTMKAQQELIDSLPEGSQARANVEDALTVTSERYLTALKDGGARSRERARDWLDVFAWVVLGVGGYILLTLAPEMSGLDTASGVVSLATRLVAFLVMVYASVGWGKAMNKAVFG